MKPAVFPQAARALVSVIFGALLSAAQDRGASNDAKGISVLSEDARDYAFAHQSPTAKEKEFNELAQKLREQDATFNRESKTAKATDRLRLRAERMEKLQPMLIRLNALSREIAKERSNRGRAKPQPVAVTGDFAPADEIKGKSEQELLELGVAVKALHQKAQDETGGKSPSEVSPGK